MAIVATPTTAWARCDRAQQCATGGIAGLLFDRSGPDQGIECKAGQFIWRPAGSRHSAWSPKGGLMLAFFQIPNKFFAADGRVTDMAGVDWDALWGRVHARASGA